MGFLDRAKERAEELAKKAKPMAEDLSKKAKPAAENMREKAKPMAKTLGEKASALAAQAKKSAEEFRGGLHGDDEPGADLGQLQAKAAATTRRDVADRPERLVRHPTGLVHDLDEQLQPLHRRPVLVPDRAHDRGTTALRALELKLDPEEALLRGDVDLRASGRRPRERQESEQHRPEAPHRPTPLRLR